MSQKKGGVILTYLQVMLRSGISIVVTPIILRYLGQSQYGLYQLAASIIVYLSILNMGISGTYVRYYTIAERKNDATSVKNINGIFLIVLSTLALICTVVGIIVIFNVNAIFADGLSSGEYNTLRVLLVFMIFNLALSFPIGVFTSNFVVHEQFIAQKVIDILAILFENIATVFILMRGSNVVGLVVLTTIFSIVKSLIYVIYCTRKLNMRFAFNNIDWNLLREILHFSTFVFISLLVDQLNWGIDKFLLGRFYGSAEVAVYSVGAQFNSYLITFGTAISAVFVPAANRLVVESNDGKKIVGLMAKVGRLQFVALGLLLSAYILFGRQFIILWAGRDYIEAYYIGLLLMCPVIFPCIQNIGIEIQKARNQHKFRSTIYACIAVSNLLISIPLCKAYGGIGCAIGTMVSLIFGNIICMNIYYHKKMKLDMFVFWGKIMRLLPSMIIPIVSGLLLNKVQFFFSSFLTFFILAMIYVTVFCASVYFIGLEEEEKTTVRNMIRPLLSRIKTKI